MCLSYHAQWVWFLVNISLQLLIGYVHNYLELWDALTWKPVAYYGCFKEDGIEDMLSSAWHSDGAQFVTTHNGGLIAFWSIDNHSQPLKVMKPYGKETVEFNLLPFCTHRLQASNYSVSINFRPMYLGHYAGLQFIEKSKILTTTL